MAILDSENPSLKMHNRRAIERTARQVAFRSASACAFIVNKHHQETFSRRALFCGEPVNSVHNKSIAAKNIRLGVRRSR
ncbi:MAG TPA: hypothetical protein VGO84_16805, partial [Burkholderiales bacterium]|nr:hypothetical protein [Burkholderiales bacterium]